MSVYEFHRGTAPLLISIPHSGTEVPEALAHRLTVVGRTLPDTDWHVHLLYDFARELGASIIKANYSRYVVDLNRSPDSAALYVGHATSPVCPIETFGGSFIYMAGHEPDDGEIAARIDQYWRPYHQRIATELAAMRTAQGRALLWDAHSIASEIPALFAGVLPEFNFGTRDGKSCPRAVSEALLQIITRDGEFGAVLDGRFKGGYITDHYGDPANGVYAVQLELARRAYMNEATEQLWEAQRAQRAQALISRLLDKYLSS
ncbi:MAG TPA: N-formylglutamate deformylase [Steroidobacteraceae bacterium]|jgi:N-formylglutamate deformylase